MTDFRRVFKSRCLRNLTNQISLPPARLEQVAADSLQLWTSLRSALPIRKLYRFRHGMRLIMQKHEATELKPMFHFLFPATARAAFRTPLISAPSRTRGMVEDRYHIPVIFGLSRLTHFALNCFTSRGNNHMEEHFEEWQQSLQDFIDLQYIRQEDPTATLPVVGPPMPDDFFLFSPVRRGPNKKRRHNK